MKGLKKVNKCVNKEGKKRGSLNGLGKMIKYVKKEGKKKRFCEGTEEGEHVCEERGSVKR